MCFVKVERFDTCLFGNLELFHLVTHTRAQTRRTHTYTHCHLYTNMPVLLQCTVGVLFFWCTAAALQRQTITDLTPLICLFRVHGSNLCGFVCVCV